MKEISIGLIGFGTVGSGVVKILQENGDLLSARAGIPLRLKRIADLDLESDRGVKVDRSVLTSDPQQILQDPEISIVVELIGGYEPARTFLLDAFRQRKQVVTANKALLAHHGTEIFQAAREAGVHIAFEAAVAGGIPILRSLREGLVANRFEKVLAILNGTCNFILTAMHEQPGLPLDEVLRKAQELGYAEADPTLDVDGTDSVHKLLLVLRLTHGIRADFQKIYREGILGIDAFDVALAKEFGYRIKLLAIIIDHGKAVEARLHPAMLPEHHPLSQVDGVFNGIYLRGDMVGEQLFYGRGAGREPTASAVVGDVIEVARKVLSVDSGSPSPAGYPGDWPALGEVMDMSRIVTNYYLRVQAKDRPGVLSKISGIMSDHSISIHSVFQKGRHSVGTVPVVFLTHRAQEANVREATKRIGELDVVEGVPVIIRIEDESLT